MLRLGQFLLQSRLNAGLVALICGLLLAFGVPLLPWFGLVLVGLVTLRYGSTEGAAVLAWYLLPEIAVIIATQIPIYLAFNVFLAVMVWLFASMLRASSDWGKVLQFAVILAAAIVMLVHMVNPEIVGWWQTELMALFERMAEQIPNYDSEQYASSIAAVARSATGSLAASSSVIALLVLFFARWWQAALFNKGGLRHEIFTLQLNSWLTIILAVVFIGLLLNFELAHDLLPVVMLPFIIKGLMLCHYMAAQFQSRIVLMIAIYTIMLIFSPYSVIMLAFFGVVDHWLNVRKRVTSLT